MGTVRKPIPDYTGDSKPGELSPEEAYKREREELVTLVDELHRSVGELENSTEIAPEKLAGITEATRDINIQLTKLAEAYIAYKNAQLDKMSADWEKDKTVLEALILVAKKKID